MELSGARSLVNMELNSDSDEMLIPTPSPTWRDMWHGRGVAAAAALLGLLALLGLSGGHGSSFFKKETSALWSASGGKCSGTLEVSNLGEFSLISASVNKPGDPASRDIVGDGLSVTLGMKSRAYFGNACTEGAFDQSEYMKENFMNKRVSYTVDLSGVGCGCNAALYMVSMKESEAAGDCDDDYYCDAMSVCGLKCAEIDLMEANHRAFHTTLHNGITAWDPKVGFGGGGTTMSGKEWLGPMDWSPEEYGPGAKCIDTDKEFQVAIDFVTHTNDEGEEQLKSLEVYLTQGSCKLTASMEQYHEMMPVLTKRLQEGMTLVLSYWSDEGMTWLDGSGYDGVEFCKARWEKDGERNCADSISLRDFALTSLDEL